VTNADGERASHRLAASRYLLLRLTGTGGEFTLPSSAAAFDRAAGKWVITNDGVKDFLDALGQLTFDALFELAGARGCETEDEQRTAIRAWLNACAEAAAISAAEADLSADDPGVGDEPPG
jgi:hypothetical protein